MPMLSPRSKSNPKKKKSPKTSPSVKSTSSRRAVVSPEEEVGSSRISNSSRNRTASQQQQQPQETTEANNSILAVDAIEASSDESSPPTFVYQHALEGKKDAMMSDLEGNCILHTLPGQIDMRFSGELYTKAITSCLDQVLQHDPTRKVTVLLDVRPGQGWPNAPAPQMMGLIRHFVNELYTQYPDALHKFILFPIPRAAIMLYKIAIKPLLMGHPQLKEVMELVPGPGLGMNSPAPLDKLAAFVSPENLIFLEEYRLKSFRAKTPKSKNATQAQSSSSSSPSKRGRSANGSVSSSTSSTQSLLAKGESSSSLVRLITNIPATITLFFVLTLQDVSVCFYMVVMMLWEGFPFQKKSTMRQTAQTPQPHQESLSQESPKSATSEETNNQ